MRCLTFRQENKIDRWCGGLTLAPAAPLSPLAPSRPGWPYRETEPNSSRQVSHYTNQWAVIIQSTMGMVTHDTSHPVWMVVMKEGETLTLCPLIPGSPGVPGNPRAPWGKEKGGGGIQKKKYWFGDCFIDIFSLLSISIYRHHEGKKKKKKAEEILVLIRLCWYRYIDEIMWICDN